MKLNHRKHKNTLFSQSLLLRSSLCLALIAVPTFGMGQDSTAITKPKSINSKYPTHIIKGKVLDAATGKPLSGVIIRTSGIDGYSVLTEDDGSYEIAVPLFTTSLYATNPSYNPITIGLGNGPIQRDIKMYPTSFKAEYSQEPNILNSYSADDFQYTAATNIKDEVQKQLGAVAHTVTRNGTSGIGSVMFLQGLNSLNVNAQPLVVIDGVVIDQEYSRVMLHDGFYNDILTCLNPQDIEKVTILRNGTAIYGAQGANGVILIQTRRNKSMATRITASISTGVTFKPKFIDMMDANGYRGYASELLKSTGTDIKEFKFLNEDPTYYYYRQYHNNTDWKNMIYRNAMTQNYGINVEGGDAVANYNLSVGYTSMNSTLKDNNMDRLNIRINSDIKLVSNFLIKFDAAFTNITRDIRDDAAPESYDEGTPTAPSFLAYVKSPFLSPYSYGNGELSDSHLDITDESYLDEALAEYSNYNYQLANPAALNSYGEAKNKNRFENSLLTLTATPEWQINKHLKLSEKFSYNLVNTNEKYYIPINGVPSYYVTSVNAYRDNEVRSLYSRQNSITSDTRINWANRYRAHSINVFGGIRFNWDSYKLTSQLGYNTGSDKTPFMSSALLNAQTKGINDSWNSAIWYAQANYNFKERYYLQANLSGEGSSRFGKDADGLKLFGTPWGIFPSIQASWVISNEPWMAGIKPVNYLKITAGYDVSGNDDIDNYAARSYFRATTLLNAIAGLSFSGIGNTKIQWETTRRFNAGIETNLFNNRLSLSFNYFNSRTSNLLMLQNLNFLSGLDQNWTNDGELKNTGFDISASSKLVNTKDWQWELGASIGHYKNEITKLPNNQGYIDHNVYGGTIRTQVGQAANVFYGYKTVGVFSTTEEAETEGLYTLAGNGITRNYFQAGDVHFADKDGNKEINENDQSIIGDPNPDIYGNIFTTLQWKRFRLDARFNYSLGNDVYNYMRSQLESGNRFMNQTTALEKRWQVEGQVTDIPRITFQDPMGNSRFSDRWIEDGSYLRLKTITLSYDLPIKSQYLQGLQFWIQANNLFTITKYLGSDPEFSITSSVIGQGIDIGGLAQSRSLVVGMKINL